MASANSDWVPIRPTLCDPAQTILRDCAQALLEPASQDEGAVHKIREQFFERANGREADAQVLRVCISVLCDLRAQGWAFKVDKTGISLQHPREDTRSPKKEKARVRDGHLVERDSQLRQSATRRFVRDMEKRRLTKHSWSSIFSLMRDGRELAEKLRAADELSHEADRNAALQQALDPCLQFIDKDSVCPFTGLRLYDVWRYFRHTWVTAYKTTPGRNIHILVRDRAARNHPVIGIAALGSSVVQMGCRDSWIGWNAQQFLVRLESKPTRKWARWVLDSLKTLIEEVYVRDLIKNSILTRPEIRSPRPETISRLRRVGVDARDQHRRFPNSSELKAPGNCKKADWEARATTPLYLWKRADALAQLLEARLKFAKAGFTKATSRNLRALLRTGPGKRAVEIILRRVVATHVGVDTLDIIICGAIAPYRSILGGKLVSLLLASPEVRFEYERRYGRACSVIASSVAGRPIVRRPRLVYLGTTSLYGVGSSQYNRLSLPPGEVGGDQSRPPLRYHELGKTAGYGSHHFSAETVKEMVRLHAEEGALRVNSIFGEGASPRLRKIRMGLDLTGLPSGQLLKHGSSRVVYGVPLASSFREVLLGFAKRPNYLLPQAPATRITRRIGDFWRRRWLSMRIGKPYILEEVASHTLAYPITHGARVPLPVIPEEVPPFLDQES